MKKENVHGVRRESDVLQPILAPTNQEYLYLCGFFIVQETKRTGPERRADARGEVFAFVDGRRSFVCRLGRRIISKTIQDLVGPEPLEPMQRLVQRRELIIGDAADLFNGLDVLLVCLLYTSDAADE